VRGDIIMGAMLGTAEADTLPDVSPRSSGDVEVPALPQGGGSRDFCVRLSSKDGRFEAENTYRVMHDKVRPGAPFPYDGDYADVVESLTAVSNVSLGPCGNRVETVIPSFWTDEAPSRLDRGVHLFVNAAGNTALVEIPGAPLIECQDVTDPETLKYTAACYIAGTTLDAHRQDDGRVPMTIFISRRLGEDDFPISIYWPHPDTWHG